MKYCLIKDGIIHKYNVKKPQIIVGEAEGIYLPIEDNQPIITDTQRISGKSYEIQGDKVLVIYTIEDIPVEEIQAKLQKELEIGIQNYINEQVQSKGYDNENSIAKYLVDTNPFYEECKTISVWIGNVWIKTHEIQSEVNAGTRPIPSLVEIIAELPVLV